MRIDYHHNASIGHRIDVLLQLGWWPVAHTTILIRGVESCVVDAREHARHVRCCCWNGIGPYVYTTSLKRLAIRSNELSVRDVVVRVCWCYPWITHRTSP